MNIGLDYDGTYTADPELWFWFVQSARKRHHKVYLVTMRYPSELAGVSQIIKASVDGVYATSRTAKRKFVAERGINIHVWIDDNPEAVSLDAVQIWTDIAPEGKPIVAKHDT